MGRIGPASTIFCCLMVFLSHSVQSQEARFNGYVVTFPSYLRSASAAGVDEQLFANVSRLRLRPSLALWEESFFMLEYEVSAAYFSSSFSYQNQPFTNP